MKMKKKGIVMKEIEKGVDLKENIMDKDEFKMIV